MSFEFKEEMLTAYVLGELAGLEKDEVAEKIERESELKKKVEELEQFCSFIGDELSKEPVADLSDEQIRSIESQFEESSKVKTRSWYFSWKVMVPAFAASLGVALVLATLTLTRLEMRSSRAPAVQMEHLRAMPSLSRPDSTGVLLPEEVSQLKALGYIEGGDELLRFADGEKEDDERNRFNTEAYDRIVENQFLSPRDKPLSTFSIDVDTASYANVRRFLNENTLPPKDAVRIEELVNYFSYDYPQPRQGPFSASVEIAEAPWNQKHRLMRIGLKGKEIPFEDAPKSNLVFLVDTSGSMNAPNKIELLKKSMRLLVNNLGQMDRVAIVVYAGSAGLVLPSTSADNKNAILGALDRLSAGGSTNGGDGIRLAYRIAGENFIQGGINRVILATDGDFNVGTTSEGELVRLIEEKKNSGVFLSVLGFGMGNYKDSTLEKIADKGDGNYAYIDTLNEANKVLVHEIGQTLITIAKDVKIQIEFNPTEVQAYRLIGYENRILQDRDFNDDKKDAGEIGAGHTVTALYEIVPPGVEVDTGSVDGLRYQEGKRESSASRSGELCTLKLRYKEPDEHTSKLLEFVVRDHGNSLNGASADFKHAASVAAFGMLLRDSRFKGSATYDGVLALAEEGRGQDRFGYRQEFIELVRKAVSLSK